ncbi:ubiquitin-like domain-containing protein [Thermovenabulum gondwanense]|uniref:Cell wall-binding protein YocH n=1 Tax=Thermovenabulum gondwanense TaxID=520767 RepID=A0A162MUV1_9FIRM|nr:ubiquitin-like domain-containing protein [Thermovenabulum gondwanense]KYO67772.1 Cell wall-binding protein YocH [Thermovenabulum gondwanense]
MKLKFFKNSIASFLIAFFVFSAALGYTYLEKSVTIVDNGREMKVKTFSTTVGELLKEKNIILSRDDKVLPEPSQKLKEKDKIIIYRAFPVKIIDGGKEITVNTLADSVENIIKKAGLNLQEKDKVVPRKDEVINNSTEIKITRVDEKVIEEVRKIPFKTITRVDYNLHFGKQNIIQQGEDGEEKIITTIVYENGKVVDKSTRKVITKPAKPQIIVRGGLMVASRGGVEFAYTAKYRMLATAYTYTGNLTRMGTKPRVGVVAVDPEVIPLGSKLYVEGYGFARAEDTGGAIKGERIDIFVESEAIAQRFGRRWVTVYLLKE